VKPFEIQVDMRGAVKMGPTHGLVMHQTFVCQVATEASCCYSDDVLFCNVSTLRAGGIVLSLSKNTGPRLWRI
jgi:hypothetical protein